MAATEAAEKVPRTIGLVATQSCSCVRLLHGASHPRHRRANSLQNDAVRVQGSPGGCSGGRHVGEGEEIPLMSRESWRFLSIVHCFPRVLKEWLLSSSAGIKIIPS